MTHLWTSFPIHIQLDDVTSHLEAKGRLSNGSWAGIPTKESALTEWLARTPILGYLCLIFDDIQSFALGEHRSDTPMVYAGHQPLHTSNPPPRIPRQCWQ